jgi:bla regulator protein blaR1
MSGVVLLNGLWQGALITGVAWVITRLLPQQHAASRYAVWFTALLALAIVPFGSLLHATGAITALPVSVQHTASAPTLVTARAASASGLWLLFLWAAGTMFFFFRLALSYVRIDRIVRDAVPAPQLGAGVMTSESVAVPIAARLFSPVVVIPLHLVALLDRADLESIVQHERAHIRRGDIAGNLVQRVIEACLFFNPWVYLIGRQLIVEREAACDDWAVQTSQEPHRYASCLVQLAQNAAPTFPALLTPSAIGPKSMLVGRVARLLNGKATQLKANYFVLGASIATFGVLALVLQTANGLASQTLPANCYHDVAVKDPVQPDIAKSDYHANVTSDALVTVSADGKPMSAKIVTSSGYPAIDRATVKAAMSSTYSAGMSNCKPTTGTYVFHVRTSP